MTKNTKEMAKLIRDAESDFIANLTGKLGFSRAEAAKALEVYRRLKILKVVPVAGGFRVIHTIPVRAGLSAG